LAHEDFGIGKSSVGGSAVEIRGAGQSAEGPYRTECHAQVALRRRWNRLQRLASALSKIGHTHLPFDFIAIHRAYRTHSQQRGEAWLAPKPNPGGQRPPAISEKREVVAQQFRRKETPMVDSDRAYMALLAIKEAGRAKSVRPLPGAWLECIRWKENF